MTDYLAAFPLLEQQLSERGLDVSRIIERLKNQKIETPSWGYGNSGTRFKVYPWHGAARTAFEKFDDAAEVHRMTGIAPSVAIHIPWDRVDDWEELRDHAASQGVSIGAVNPNVFQDDAYKLGSMCNPDPTIRQQAIDHMIECCQIAGVTGSKLISLWFADGTNYAGQDDLRARKHRMEDALKQVYGALPPDARMLIEYKFFEPAFYHTDLADWGMAYTMALKLGPQAQVLVDTGHHASGTNVEHIVSFLLDEGRLGGFHFNSRRYADDDLIVGSANPFELFAIYNELAAAEEDQGAVGDTARDVAYMIDQSHNIEAKVEAMIQSVLNCQVAYAKSLLVDRPTLASRQQEGDVLGAHRVLTDAFDTDVRPLLARVREEMGVPVDPIAAFRTSGYSERVAEQRGSAAGSGGGYPGA